MALTDVTNPPPPDAGIAQANPEGIARSLVGNDLVDKFGHAMGVRPTTPADVMRDAYLGATIGPTNVQKMHADATKQLQDQRTEAIRTGLAQQAADRQKMQAVMDALTWVRNPANVPLGFRAPAYKEILQKYGFDVTPTVLGMLTKADGLSDKKIKGIQTYLTSSNATTGDLGLLLTDAEAFTKLTGQIAQQDQTRQETANAVLAHQKGLLDIQNFQNRKPPATLEDHAAVAHYNELLRRRVPVLDANGDPQVGPDNKTMVTRYLTPAERDQEMASSYPAYYSKTHEMDQASLVPNDGQAPVLPMVQQPAAAAPLAEAGTGPGAALPFLGPKAVTLPGGRVGFLPDQAIAGPGSTGHPSYKTKDLSIPNKRGVIADFGGGVTASKL